MDALRALYEAELRRLCSGAAAFAQAHPALARRLEITGEGHSEDPQVQRLMQGAALLGARVQQRIDDGFAGFTRPLLRQLFPQALRPFPACAIVAFEPHADGQASAEAVTLPRGTRLKAPVLRGVRCEFRSAFGVPLWPLRVAGVAFRAGTDAAAGVPWPKGCGAMLSLRLQWTATEAAWPSAAQPPLRLFLGGDAARAVALREALCGAVLGVLVQTDAGSWRAAAGCLPRAVGFGEDESLFEAGAFTQPAQRLLAEYFGFPRKFDFIDLPWPHGLQASTAREVVLHFALDAAVVAGPQGRLLEGVGLPDLVPGCTPVVNLFARRVQPAAVAGQASHCTVAADSEHPWGHEVFDIEQLHWTPPPPEPPQEVLPLYSLRWGGRTSDDALAWLAVDDDGDGAGCVHGAGHDAMRIAIVRHGSRPAPVDSGALTAEILATNGALARELDTGTLLEPEGSSTTCCARLLQRPTPSLRFDLGGDAPWRLISHLSPNPLWINGRGIEALRELLVLYDLPRSGVGARLAQGLLAVESRPVTGWLRLPEPYMARGTEVRLTVEAGCFAATGLRLFAQVLEHWLSQLAHWNSFTRLKLLSATGAELFSGAARQGAKPLL